MPQMTTANKGLSLCAVDFLGRLVIPFAKESIGVALGSLRSLFSPPPPQGCQCPPNGEPSRSKTPPQQQKAMFLGGPPKTLVELEVKGAGMLDGLGRSGYLIL